MLLLLIIPTVLCCEFLGQMKSVGVTPDDLENPLDYPLINYNIETTQRAEAYLIVHQSLNQSLQRMLVHKGQPNWRRDTFVCVISPEPDIELFDSFWALGVANVVMDTDSGTFIFNHFNGSMVQVHQGQLSQSIDAIWTNLNGHQLTISIFSHPLGYYENIDIGSGIDGSFLYELSHWMNFTPNLINGVSYSVLKDQLEQLEAEFGGNSHFLRYYGEMVELTNVVYGDEVCIVVKSAGILRGWDIFLSTFHWQVWVTIFCAALITNLILTIMCPRLNWTRWLPLTLRAMFMIPLGKPPTAVKERLIIGGCLLYGVVVVTTYQATLYHFIHARIHYKDPERLVDVRMAHSKERITDALLDHYAVEARRKEVELLVKTGRLNSNIHIVPQCQSAYNLGYPVSHGSPYYKYITRFAQIAFESGLPQAWYRQTIFEQTQSKTRQIHNTVRVLNLSDFEVAFFSLIMGHCVSCTVFLLEILSDHLILKKHLDAYKPYLN